MNVDLILTAEYDNIRRVAIGEKKAEYRTDSDY